jgi:type II secretory pathway pseudopilin PulG
MKARSNNPVFAGAFTLTELLVVIGLIVLALAIVLPSIIPLLASGSQSQGRSVISSLLGAAHGMAIERGSYAMVHFQMGTGWVPPGSNWRDVPDGNCWVAVLVYDRNKRIEDRNDPRYGQPNPTYGKFIPAQGFAPRKLPGDMALGEVSADWLINTGEHFKGLPNEDAATEPEPDWDFTTFHVIFGPDGSLVRLVPDANGVLSNPVIDTTRSPFWQSAPTDRDEAAQRIWRTSNVRLDEPGVRMMVAFSYKQIKSLSDADYTVPGSRAHYLENDGTYLCINPYTGQLLPSE